MKTLREDALYIMNSAIRKNLPDSAVASALAGVSFPGKVRLVSIGKAACRMAETACNLLGKEIEGGLVVTKYGHSIGTPLPFPVIEAGHPVPDENSMHGAEAALRLTRGLTVSDTVLFLVSGGGSALFEKPLIPLPELQDITDCLLRYGADIDEINTVRKHLSAVKGGRFALHCSPAHVFCIMLSDVLGDDPAVIASGPAVPDRSTSEEALSVLKKYNISLSPAALEAIGKETPKKLSNITLRVAGGVGGLCRAGEEAARTLGYETVLLTDSYQGEAKEAGQKLAALAEEHRHSERPLAFLMGGEPVVRVTGQGLGGRAQELALAASEGLDGIPNAAVFSFGSDGTDGPTDAAGGVCDGSTVSKLAEFGLSAQDLLRENDAYHALELTGGLIKTGPTGTNVNDLAALLIKPE